MKLSRRSFFAATQRDRDATRLMAEAAPTSIPAFELDELTIAQLQKYSAQSLVEKYLARIQQVIVPARRCAQSSKRIPTR